MKKFISILLVLVMVFSLGVPAFAAGENEYLTLTGSGKVPVVIIYGDGEEIVNKDQKIVFKFSQMLSMLGGSEEGALGEAVMNVLIPFLIEGLANDEWDNYYDALEKEIGDLFKEARLDKNGNVWNETGISEAAKNTRDKPLTKTYTENSIYGLTSFLFKYDWRLDPLENAVYLRDYVEKVKAVTGHEKISIVSKCLGNNVLNAYLAEYGSDDLVGVAFAASVANGAEIISEPLSGNFTVDGGGLARMMLDLEDLGKAELGGFITSTVELLEDSGALDAVIGVTKEKLYGKLVEGVTSALALSTFFTWPAYWSCVTAEDYPAALNYVFGKEGSEKRKEYAGLIEKLDNFDKKVRQRGDEIMQELKDDGVNVCVISKYGRQIAPICKKSIDEVADQFVSVKLSSYGATTGTIYRDLDEKYIEKRVAEGKGKYISPDKQIDASTCAFPDSTWFFKGVSHSDYTTLEDQLLYMVSTYERQLTVDDFEFSQFITFNIDRDKPVDGSNGTHASFLYKWEKMTEENCDNEVWTANEVLDKPEGRYERLLSFLIALFNWLRELVLFIQENK